MNLHFSPTYVRSTTTTNVEIRYLTFSAFTTVSPVDVSRSKKKRKKGEKKRKREPPFFSSCSLPPVSVKDLYYLLMLLPRRIKRSNSRYHQTNGVPARHSFNKFQTEIIVPYPNCQYPKYQGTRIEQLDSISEGRFYRTVRIFTRLPSATFCLPSGDRRFSSTDATPDGDVRGMEK